MLVTPEVQILTHWYVTDDVVKEKAQWVKDLEAVFYLGIIQLEYQQHKAIWPTT
jgi:hypothetical protein